MILHAVAPQFCSSSYLAHAARNVALNPDAALDQILEGMEIRLTDPVSSKKIQSFVVLEEDELPPALFYPADTIRNLSDPIFAPHPSMIGIYELAAYSPPTGFCRSGRRISNVVPRPGSDATFSRP